MQNKFGVKIFNRMIYYYYSKIRYMNTDNITMIIINR